MIDTVILLLGFACAGLVFSLCAVEYGFVAQRSAIYTLCRKLPTPARLHSLVLALVCVCAIASMFVSTQLSTTISLASQSVQSEPASAALVVKE